MRDRKSFYLKVSGTPASPADKDVPGLYYFDVSEALEDWRRADAVLDAFCESMYSTTLGAFTYEVVDEHGRVHEPTCSIGEAGPLASFAQWGGKVEDETMPAKTDAPPPRAPDSPPARLAVAPNATPPRVHITNRQSFFLKVSGTPSNPADADVPGVHYFDVDGALPESRRADAVLDCFFEQMPAGKLSDFTYEVYDEQGRQHEPTRPPGTGDDLAQHAQWGGQVEDDAIDALTATARP